MIILVLVRSVHVVEGSIEGDIDIFVKFTEVQPSEEHIRCQDKEHVLLLMDLGETSGLKGILDSSIGSRQKI